MKRNIVFIFVVVIITVILASCANLNDINTISDNDLFANSANYQTNNEENDLCKIGYFALFPEVFNKYFTSPVLDNTNNETYKTEKYIDNDALKTMNVSLNGLEYSGTYYMSCKERWYTTNCYKNEESNYSFDINSKTNEVVSLRIARGINWQEELHSCVSEEEAIAIADNFIENYRLKYDKENAGFKLYNVTQDEETSSGGLSYYITYMYTFKDERYNNFHTPWSIIISVEPDGFVNSFYMFLNEEVADFFNSEINKQQYFNYYDDINSNKYYDRVNNLAQMIINDNENDLSYYELKIDLIGINEDLTPGCWMTLVFYEPFEERDSDAPNDPSLDKDYPVSVIVIPDFKSFR